MKNYLRLNIEVGKVPILIELNDYGVFRRLRDFYKPFETERDPLYKIKVDINNNFKSPPNLKDIFLSYFNNIYRIESREFKGCLDFKKNSGEISICSSWPKEAFVNALKNICVFCIIKRRGIVLHASGIIRNSRAYIFYGPSGSGKSTVARLSSRYPLLSEELIGIKPINRMLKAFALPYKGDSKFPQRVNNYFQIAGLFKLVKDKTNYVKIIPKSQALADFLILPYGFENLTTCSNFLSRYSRLIEEVACFELHFLPNSSFWSCIDEHINQMS